MEIKMCLSRDLLLATKIFCLISLFALKTTNTLAATSSKLHCSTHHALGSQENNTNLLDVAALPKKGLNFLGPD